MSLPGLFQAINALSTVWIASAVYDMTSSSLQFTLTRYTARQVVLYTAQCYSELQGKPSVMP